MGTILIQAALRGAGNNDEVESSNNILLSQGKSVCVSTERGKTVDGTSGSPTALTATRTEITTAAAGKFCQLPAAKAGAQVSVINFGANLVGVLPPSGGQINRAGADVVYSLASGAGAMFNFLSTNECFAVKGS